VIVLNTSILVFTTQLVLTIGTTNFIWSSIVVFKFYIGALIVVFIFGFRPFDPLVLWCTVGRKGGQ